MNHRDIGRWALVIFPAFVFVQSLFFKFSGAEETVIIFDTIGAWMAGLPVLSVIAGPFAAHGAWAVGLIELLAAVVMLIPASRIFGAGIGLGVVSGAVFFHLVTPLGVVRMVDAAGSTDGGALFAMACLTWLCCAATVWIEWRGRGSAAGGTVPV
ncbi:MAG: hypothetical protein V2J24_13680 [Pseudomonadales bacterium]|jgi:hypothetical protein|nr:hypothetical protein [Pseudomonadales bacterium]